MHNYCTVLALVLVILAIVEMLTRLSIIFYLFLEFSLQQDIINVPQIFCSFIRIMFSELEQACKPLWVHLGGAFGFISCHSSDNNSLTIRPPHER